MATITGLVNMSASVVGGYIWEELNPHSLLTTGLIIAASAIPILWIFVKEPKVREQ